jgi:hypothetical protein
MLHITRTFCSNYYSIYNAVALEQMNSERLKMMIYTRLLHNSIGNMPDFDFSVYCDIPVGYRAIPNIMIAPAAMPYEITGMFSRIWRTFFSYSAIYAKTASDSILNIK